MIKCKNKKGALEFSFAWIFAIVAGVFILILAIYGVIKFINLSQTEISAKTAKEIGVLINPLESSFESAKRSMIITGGETRIYTDCTSPTTTSVFGKQIIRTSQKSYDKWSEEGFNVSFQNRYIFSKNPVEGRTFYLFSKPFELPFKVADLVYLTSTKDKYCFVNPPDDIEDEIRDLTRVESEEESKYENFLVEDRETDCLPGSTTVCFSGACDIYVSSTYVKKGSKTMYYQGDALMYAAIFSDKEEYECQLKRLMSRVEQLYELYWDKSDFILQKSGCNTESELDIEIMQMISALKGFQDSQDIDVIYNFAEQIDAQNEYAECKLW